ncbi:HAMP domain-containing sensor histidine kinase [Spirosoma endbachense]|uniref:histidine kinase n=1 Tax=Spirosoma endbachense TaxID=2666025 RepID=A0A6P1VSA4_9BACT|nr:HAMP domain-containing sensor histidine kinase [Spirosoma endbachense]QHV95963.1 HAMP domain-containing protein [Spirosoma endbachense]
MDLILLHTHSVMAYILVLVSSSMYVYLVNLKVEAPGKQWFKIFYFSQIVWQTGDMIRYSIHPAYVGSLLYQLQIILMFVPALGLVEIAYIQFLYRFVKPAFERERKIVFYVMIAYVVGLIAFNSWNEFYNGSHLLLMQSSMFIYGLLTNLWAIYLGWRKGRLFAKQGNERAAKGNSYMAIVNLCFVIPCIVAVIYGIYSTVGFWTFFILIWLGNLSQIVVSITYAAVPTSFQIKLVGFTFVMIATVLLIVTLVFYPPLYPTDYGPRMAQQDGIIKLLAIITLSTAGLILILPRILRVTLTRPLQQLLEGVQQVNSGNLTTVVPVGLPDEIGDLTQNFNWMTQSLKKANDELTMYTEQLEEQIVERTAEITQQKSELEIQRDSLEKTLLELKETQVQLIQKEKMASLGELTAGIAHEIQNPLNFVNNFSKISIELLEELKEEITADHKTDATDLADDLIQNVQRISNHGQRADSIVKGMLQLSHSSTSTGKKQPTNLNDLVSEYLQLAFKEMVAKNKNFSAELSVQLDTTIDHVKVVPQDIGRVLLNVFNNAFYAVNQKQKQLNTDYKPAIVLSTQTDPGSQMVVVCIRDNGTGIPDSILDKIYQPFFTTKPTGQGSTGLGLSLSYNIVTQGHAGIMTTTSEFGQYTEVTIRLPVSAE